MSQGHCLSLSESTSPSPRNQYLSPFRFKVEFGQIKRTGVKRKSSKW